MLRIAVPHVDMWNSWFTGFENSPAGLAPLNELVDAVCAEVGRDPATLERTVAVYVQFERGAGRAAGSGERPEAPPITGSKSEMAESLAGFAAAGIGHVQAVLDPIDTRSVEELAGVIDLIR
jgi:alkanesulfonate monooxygenase SsuD/methylene tetrahydromethanopterin reductase-like flavin-dependent oxidoreductase (luciferase family)